MSRPANSWAKIFVTAVIAIAAIVVGSFDVAAAVILIAWLDLYAQLSWLVASVTFLGGVLTLLIAFLPFIPLQWLPAAPISRKQNGSDITVSLTTLIVSYFMVQFMFPESSFGVKMFAFPVLIFIIYWICKHATNLRTFLSDKILENLLLPALSVATSVIPIGHGRKANAADVIREIRIVMFGVVEGSMGPWTNVTIPGEGDVCIDAAYWINPAMLGRSPQNQAWMLCCMANAEVSFYVFQPLLSLNINGII
jgi:hypothetical protein